MIGAVLDRNGLRPSRYWVTDDDLVVMASEVGVIDIDPAKVVTKGRLQPGRMFLIDTAQGRIVDDEEIKTTLAAEHPYGEWLEQSLVELDDLPEREHVVFSHDSVLRRQQLFGYTHEELKVILAPMARQGHRADRLDGHRHADRRAVDRGRACCSTTSPSCSPRSPTRRSTPSARRSSRRCRRRSGPRPTCCGPARRAAASCVLPFPIIDNDELSKIVHANDDGRFPGLRSHVVKGLYRVAGGGLALERALSAICREVSAAIEDGARHHRAVGPQRRRRRGADPVAAADGRRAPPPRAHEAAHDGRAARRVR